MSKKFIQKTLTSADALRFGESLWNGDGSGSGGILQKKARKLPIEFGPNTDQEGRVLSSEFVAKMSELKHVGSRKVDVRFGEGTDTEFILKMTINKGAWIDPETGKELTIEYINVDTGDLKKSIAMGGTLMECAMITRDFNLVTLATNPLFRNTLSNKCGPLLAERLLNYDGRTRQTKEVINANRFIPAKELSDFMAKHEETKIASDIRRRLIDHSIYEHIGAVKEMVEKEWDELTHPSSVVLNTSSIDPMIATSRTSTPIPINPNGTINRSTKLKDILG